MSAPPADPWADFVDDPSPTPAVPRGPTDDGNALRLIDTYGDAIRYVAAPADRWLRWDDYRWVPDDTGHIQELARQVARDLPATDKDTAAWQKSSKSHASILAMQRLARSDPRVAVSILALDAHPQLLCTPAGVIKLTDGTLAPPNRDQLHTKATHVAPDMDAKTPRWESFLDDTFGGDQDLIGYVQRLVGASITGDVGIHILPFCHGDGGNGKSVFLETVSKVLGDYATPTPANFLMAGRDKHETEIAALLGMRFVICSEVNQDDRFDEAKVKRLTGGERIHGRYLYKEGFAFNPTHHLWLVGNHQPSVKSGGGASFWRRLRLIPFTHTVPEDERVANLAGILADQEGPGILAWMIAGAVEIHAHGLRDPAAVLAATELYAEEEDHLARFIADRCDIGGGSLIVTPTKKIRDAYVDWCKEEGIKPMQQTPFGRDVKTKYGVKDATRSNGQRRYQNIALKDLVADESDGDARGVPSWVREPPADYDEVPSSAESPSSPESQPADGWYR